MEAQVERRIRERRATDEHSGDGRRVEKERRRWSRRHDAGGAMSDGGKFDRRGAHPSLFESLGFQQPSGARRTGLPRRSGVVRRSFVRRRADR